MMTSLLHTLLLNVARRLRLLPVLLPFLLPFLLPSFRPNLRAQPADPPLSDDVTEVLRRGGEPARTGLISPLPIPLVLAGNFGELRPDHFHTGLDFKTQGREGIPVLAATDGVIERVKVSPYGYGQALYLRSPDGLTTVYAHLQRFNGPLATWVLEEQYRQQSNAIDVSPKRSFAFAQGDTIAFSGNSGGSFGPHLHFEVRQSATQRPINPLLWDFPVVDGTPPEIGALWVLPADGASVNGQQTPVRIMPGHGPIEVHGAVRFALDALDRLDGARNVCGPFDLALMIEGKEHFRARLDTLDFSLQRDMNAHAYYDVYARQRTQTHRLHRLPGNRLPIYRGQGDRITCLPGDTIRLSLRATDVHGNESSAGFTLIGGKPRDDQGTKEPGNEGTKEPGNEGTKERGNEGRRDVVFVRYDAPVAWSSPDGAQLFVPANTFYDDHDFPLRKRPRGRAWDWEIGDPTQPASGAFTVHLPLPDATSSRRWYAARLSDRGEVEGTYALERLGNEALVLSTKTTGVFRVLADDVPPTIRLQGGPADWTKWGQIRWTLTDDGVGLGGDHSAWVDDKWVRLAWDPRIERLTYELSDARHSPGTTQTWRIRATDELGNVGHWTQKLTH